jgi:hypothetical protein
MLSNNQKQVALKRLHSKRDAADSGSGELKRPSRVHEFEQFSGAGISYWVYDRSECVVGVFPDLEIARIVTDLVNSTGQ